MSRFTNTAGDRVLRTAKQGFFGLLLVAAVFIVGDLIKPHLVWLGLAPDYNAWKPIDLEKLKARESDPEVLRGAEAYNRKEFEEAYKIWLPRAEAGNAEAMFLVGFEFYRGLGVEANAEVALHWYQRAAKLGHVRSIAGVGILTKLGHGTPKDPVRAIEYLERAAELNDKYAVNELATSYDVGEGIERNGLIAHELYKKALDLGLCSAANSLAYDFSKPEDGLEKDLETALYYSEMAETLGCVHIPLKLSILKSMN